MGLKKRSKIEPTFSMSSLTDIIFLLLIFFMLTSSLVTPNALNLKLPGHENTSVSTDDSKVPEITVSSRGTYRYDGSKASLSRVSKKLQRLSRKRKPLITIAPDKNAPVESVVAIMSLAMQYHIQTIMAAETD